MELTDSLAAYLNNLCPNFEPVYDKIVPEGEKLEKIKEKLALCNILIVIITPGTLESIPVADEITFAIKSKMKIIPCKDKYLDKNWEELPWNLNEYKGIEFENIDELKRKTYNALMKLLESLLKELEPSIPKKTLADKHPFKIEESTHKEHITKVEESGTALFDFNIKNHSYVVFTSLREGGKILSLSLDRKALSIIVDIETSRDNSFVINLDPNLINTTNSEGETEPFIVLVDDEEVEYDEFVNADGLRGIKVLVKKNAKQIEIIGTQIAGISYMGKATEENEIRTLKGSAVPHNGQYLDPEILTVKVGDTVKFINADTAAHTFTSGTPNDGPDGVFDSRLLMTDFSFTVTFNESGTYHYFDVVHPWIIGTIVVEN